MMNLLFFDIECASVYKTTAKICAFGYVLCDEHFNVLEKEDLLINPKGKFHLTDGRGERGLVLPYDYGEFKQHPTFPQLYGRLKKMLEDKNNAVIGHATLNDVKYLDLETRRFRLPSFNFSFSDSQLMYMTAIGDYSRQYGLEFITRDLQVEFTPHRAADDAYATMRIVEAMCRSRSVSCAQLENLLKISRGKIAEHKITVPTSAGQRAYRDELQRAKARRSANRQKFSIFLSRRRKKKEGALLGKTFNFSRMIEDEIEISIPVVEKIYALGGAYTSKLKDCNVYVRADADETVRTRNAEETEGLQVITLEMLRGMLNGAS